VAEQRLSGSYHVNRHAAGPGPGGAWFAYSGETYRAAEGLRPARGTKREQRGAVLCGGGGARTRY